MSEDLAPPALPSSTTLAPHPLRVLHDRVLTMTTDARHDLVDQIDPNSGGVVVAGAHRFHTIAQLRRLHPDIPLLAEPSSASAYIATAKNPFQIDDDGLIPESLDSLLQAQRDAGASLALTPSGQIQAQDSSALKAVVAGANKVPDQDLVTLVVVADIWLTEPSIATLCAVLKTSEHPVALGVINGNGDPLERKGAVAGYRRIAQEVPGMIAWRTDLSGIGALAYGATAAVIGRVPSQRRYSAAGSRPHSSNKVDQTPHVLLPDLMRYSRSLHMQTDWFAQGDSPTCPCPVCRGAALDRFDDSSQAKADAYLHNAVALRGIVAECVDAPRRAGWWIERLRQAKAQHAALSARLGMEIKPLPYIDRWLGEAE